MLKFSLALCALFSPLTAVCSSSAIAFESKSASSFLQQIAARVLPSNYTTHAYSYTFANSDEYFYLQNDISMFRTFLSQRVNELCLELNHAPRKCAQESAGIKSLWVDKSTDEVSARELALWFYKLDGVNWFSHEKMLQEATGYLNQRELYMVRGFNAAGVLAQELVVSDLPVVIDTAERSLTILVNELKD